MTTSPLEMKKTPLRGAGQIRKSTSSSKRWRRISHSCVEGPVELDLFTAIGDGHNTVSSLANRINGSDRGIRILRDCLVAIGFLKVQGRYGLSRLRPVLRFAATSCDVDSHSAWYRRPVR